ncbi:MAG: glycosyltransferase [Acidimicrobiales bacterium]
MTVVFDLIGFQNREHGERGIARYVQNLALGLERVDPEFVDHYLVHPHVPLPQGIEPLITSGKLLRSDRLLDCVDHAAGGLFIAGSVFELQEPLSTILPAWARAPQWRTAAVLYDLIPLRFADWYLSNPVVRYEYDTRVAALRHFDHLLTISEATGRDAVEFLGIGAHRITTIWAGADAQFRPPTSSHVEVARDLARRIEGLRPSYLMFPSGIERRKNIDRLLEAYAGLPSELRRKNQLVLVCRTTDHERVELSRTAERLGIADDLLVTGFVSDDDLVSLYQGAELVVFPAIYEGFGLPVLEAMQCGAPVICSDSSSLVEVQTDPAARFDPNSVDAIERALVGALGDPVERERLRSLPPPDFSWERSARATIDGLTTLTAPTHLPERRPSLALVTPLPRQRSGIATYAARLIEHLRDDLDITVFVEGELDDVDAIDGVAIQPLRLLPAFIERGATFDETLYFMGNSSFHVDALEMLERVPGDVLLHDVRLSGLYSEVRRLAPERLPYASMGAALEEMYPERYRRSVVASPDLWPETAARFGILMSAAVARRAKRLFVHSRYAATLVELDAGRRPEHLFDIPCPTIDPVDTPRASAPLIASFGIVAPVKQPVLLIEALALVRASVPAAQLVFAGGCDPAYQEELATFAADRGVAEAVRFLGHVDDDEFQALQQEAAVAVQLRAFTNGESSAAITETLAVGLPTIVSDLGSMAELPRDVVAHLDPQADAAELASLIAALLEDAEQRASLGRRSLEYAAAHSFEAAAEVVRQLVVGTQRS